MDSIFTLSPPPNESFSSDPGAPSAGPVSEPYRHRCCHTCEALVDNILDSLATSQADEADGQTTCLLKSFDMIFQLQQRSEEIRCLLEKIDRALLISRSPSRLITQLVTILEDEFELAAVQILFRPDHPVATAFLWSSLSAVGTIPEELLDAEDIFSEDPFVLDDPSGSLAHRLFGERAILLSSATVANLSCDGQLLGLLCLGSQDPDRYRGGMRTDLIATLAEKISLGILNAWDHEKRFRDAMVGSVEGLYTEAFFLEFLQKKFNLSWRTQAVFSLMALSWHTNPQRFQSPLEKVARLVTRNVRSSDLVAIGSTVKLWVLLPHTSMEQAHPIAERLRGLADHAFKGQVRLAAGITAFSRGAPVASTLLGQAHTALAQALTDVNPAIVARALDEP